LKFFGEPPAPLSAVEPQHIRQYLDWRTAKIRANREIAWLSTAWNWARGNGTTNCQNPTEGVRRNKEKGRDIYVEDGELAAILAHADEPLKEAMELAYLIGQRPSDLRGISETDIQGDVMLIQQSKTGVKMRIAIVGRLAELLEGIRARKRAIGSSSLSLLVNGKGEAMTKYMLRGGFDRAREASIRASPDMAARLRAIQFRDLRAKAASDIENIERAQKLLGHTTQAMTQHYVRRRRGDKISPVK
jgi:integrase